jgi:hypothetical protein
MRHFRAVRVRAVFASLTVIVQIVVTAVRSRCLPTCAKWRFTVPSENTALCVLTVPPAATCFVHTITVLITLFVAKLTECVSTHFILAIHFIVAVIIVGTVAVFYLHARINLRFCVVAIVSLPDTYLSRQRFARIGIAVTINTILRRFAF